jgi:hypothetical protein
MATSNDYGKGLAAWREYQARIQGADGLTLGPTRDCPNDESSRIEAALVAYAASAEVEHRYQDAHSEGHAWCEAHQCERKATTRRTDLGGTTFALCPECERNGHEKGWWRQEGPLVSVHVRVSCGGCHYASSKKYVCQDDWGFDNFCAALGTAENPKSIGDRPPSECPYLDAAIAEAKGLFDAER